MITQRKDSSSFHTKSFCCGKFFWEGTALARWFCVGIEYGSDVTLMQEMQGFKLKDFKEIFIYISSIPFLQKNNQDNFSKKTF